MKFPNEMRITLVLLGLVLITTATARLYAALSFETTYEDAFITYRYSENIAKGMGFVYNTNEKVLGTTTPLFTLLLSIPARLGMSVLTASKVMGGLADIGTVVFVFIILNRFISSRAGVMAGVLIALTPRVILWSLSGMETSTFTFSTVVAFWCLATGRHRLMAIALAVASLLRPEGLLAAALCLAWLLWKLRRSALPSLAIFGAIMLPWALFAYAYFGDVVPNSVHAKVTLYVAHGSYSRNLATLIRVFWGSPFRSILSLMAIVGIIRIILIRSPALIITTVWFLAYLAGLWLSRTHIHPWYIIPPYAAYLVLSAVGLDAAIQLGARILRVPRVVLHSATGVGVIAVTVLLSVRVAGAVGYAEAQYLKDERTRIAAGKFIEEWTERDSVVLVEAIGQVGYYSNRYMLDLTGLVSPQVLSYWSRSEPHLAILQEFNPDYYLREPYNESLSGIGIAWLRENYVPIAVFDTRYGLVLPSAGVFKNLVGSLEIPPNSPDDTQGTHVLYARK